MNFAVIGSGGREHAICYKLKQSSKIKKLICIPGNAGTQKIAENIKEDISNFKALYKIIKRENIDIVVVGPELPLVEGLVDYLNEKKVRVFGPDRFASQLEASKAFSKDFMVRHGIPTARYKVVNTVSEALEHLWSIDYPVVIKASGLAAGKGVLIPENLNEAVWAVRAIMEDRCFGSAGDQVIIEEKLIGTENKVKDPYDFSGKKIWMLINFELWMRTFID